MILWNQRQLLPEEAFLYLGSISKDMDVCCRHNYFALSSVPYQLHNQSLWASGAVAVDQLQEGYQGSSLYVCVKTD